MKSSELQRLLATSEQLHRQIDKLLPAHAACGASEQGTVAVDAALIGAEHARANRALMKLGAERSAFAILRLQADALIRGAWGLWLATEEQATELGSAIYFGTPLIVSDEQQEDVDSPSIPLPQTRLDRLLDAPSIPLDFVVVLEELKRSFLKPSDPADNLGAYYAEEAPQEFIETLHERNLRISNELMVASAKLLLLGIGQGQSCVQVDQLAVDSKCLLRHGPP